MRVNQCEAVTSSTCSEHWRLQRIPGVILSILQHLLLSMVYFSPSILQQKQVYNCEANNVGVVHHEQRGSFINQLHGKAAVVLYVQFQHINVLTYSETLDGFGCGNLWKF